MGRKRKEINPECGKRLKEWLSMVGVKQSELSNVLYVQPQYLSDIIRGIKRLTPEMAMNIENCQYSLTGHDIPVEKRVSAEWLLCKSNYLNELTKIGTALEQNGNENEILFSLIRFYAGTHGYALNMVTPQNQSDSAYDSTDFAWELKKDNKVVTKYTMSEIDELKNEIAHYSNYLVSNLLYGIRDN